MEGVEITAASSEEVIRAVREVAQRRPKRLVLRVKARDAASAAELVRDVLSDTIPFTIIVEVEK